MYQVYNAYEFPEDQNCFKSCWYPTCYIYVESVPIEWQKIRSRQFCQKMMVLFGVNSLEELKNVVKKCEYDGHIKYSRSWDAAPAILSYISVDEIGTLN